MASKSDPPGALRSLSVRQLILIFFGAVGVCAVFFALGFLVGSNGRTPNPSAPQVERVAPPSEIPPTVNQPLESSDSGATSNSKSQTPAVIEQDLKPTSVSPTSASSPPRGPPLQLLPPLQPPRCSESRKNLRRERSWFKLLQPTQSRMRNPW